MAAIFRRVIQTIDSHTEGNSTRVITGGYPIPPGRTLFEWAYPALAAHCRRRGAPYPALGPDGEILGEIPRG